MKTVVGRRLSFVAKSTPGHRWTGKSLLAALLLLVSASCTNKPPLRLSISGNTANINVETLGEYGTSIVHVELENTHSHTAVWELKGSSGKPVLHAFVLKEGENPVSLRPQGGTYEIIAPAGTNVFRLDRGVEYELSLWKEPDSAPRRVTIQFQK